MNYGRVAGLTNVAGTNPSINQSKNEGFSPTIGDKDARNWQTGTRGLISDDNENNQHKQNPTDLTSAHNSRDNHKCTENISANEGCSCDINNDESDGNNNTGDTPD